MYDNIVAQEIARKKQQAPLTDFGSVNPSTKLDSLNLNWQERDLPERLRTKHVHRLHPYMGKFIPQIVEIFLHKYKPNLIYDPFCGSGTTLVEANTLGIASVGTDISAFNVMLSRAKTDTYDIDLLERELRDALCELDNLAPRSLGEEGDLFASSVCNSSTKPFLTNNEYILKWFAPQARHELLCYKSLTSRYRYQDLLRIVLSRSARSARLVKHYDLDFPKKPQTEPYDCHKHGRTCIPVAESRKFLRRYTFDTLSRVKEFDRVKSDAEVQVIHDDSREVGLPEKIDMVFTSPPYIGLIDYHDQHRYAYELLDLENNESKEIGAARLGKSVKAKKEYIEGINQVLVHTRQYMAKNSIMAIVVNDRHDLYSAKEVGFKSIGRVERHVNRRTGRRSGAFYESILIWKKK